MITDNRSYILRCLDSLTQALNAIVFCGDPDESTSGRCFREKRKTAMKIIDTLFFFQENHCQKAFELDLKRAKRRIKIVEETHGNS